MLCLTAVKLNILDPEDAPLTPGQPFGIIYISLATFEASDFVLIDTKKQSVTDMEEQSFIFHTISPVATLNVSDSSAKKYRVFIDFE